MLLGPQHTQLVLNSAREKRDMEQRHAAIKKKVTRDVLCEPSPDKRSRTRATHALLRTHVLKICTLVSLSPRNNVEGVYTVLSQSKRHSMIYLLVYPQPIGHVEWHPAPVQSPLIGNRKSYIYVYIRI